MDCICAIIIAFAVIAILYIFLNVFVCSRTNIRGGNTRRYPSILLDREKEIMEAIYDMRFDDAAKYIKNEHALELLKEKNPNEDTYFELIATLLYDYHSSLPKWESIPKGDTDTGEVHQLKHPVGRACYSYLILSLSKVFVKLDSLKIKDGELIAELRTYGTPFTETHKVYKYLNDNTITYLLYMYITLHDLSMCKDSFSASDILVDGEGKCRMYRLDNGYLINTYDKLDTDFARLIDDMISRLHAGEEEEYAYIKSIYVFRKKLEDVRKRFTHDSKMVYASVISECKNDELDENLESIKKVCGLA